MADSTKPHSIAQDLAQPHRFFKIQMKAWTNFDASRMELTEIADRIERGLGFLTAIEVMKVAEDVNAIDDAEVRQSFEIVIAAEKILQNVSELPKALRERLYTALSKEIEGSKRTLAA
jgi:hypothetical protein